YVAEDVPAAFAGAAGATGVGAPVEGGNGRGGFWGIGKLPSEGNSFAGVVWRRRSATVSAREQIEHAKARVAAARERARNRAQGRRGRAPGDFHTVNVGVGFAV